MGDGSHISTEAIFSRPGIDKVLSHPIANKILAGINFIERVTSPRLTETELNWVLPARSISSEVLRNSRDIVPNILEITNDKGLDLGLLDTHYIYRMSAVFSNHENPNDFEASLYPNIDCVNSFIDWLKSQENSIKITDQMEKLLEISGNDIVEATKLGMISFRIIARNLDNKAYPDINLTKEDRDICNSKLLPFVDGDVTQDVIGDHYYFYTSMLTSFASVSIGNRFLDEHSAQIMSFARRFIANQPVVANHMVAFKLGKDTAREILEQHK